MDGDIVVEKDFENGIEEWKVKPEDNGDAQDDLLLETDPDGVFPVQLVPPKDYDMPEVKAAIAREISKYECFGSFFSVWVRSLFYSI